VGADERDPAVPLETGARVTTYRDGAGRLTEDPRAAVSGEVAEYGPNGQVRRRTRFFLTQRELPWLPVGEPAFLLWVLVALMLVWLAIGVALQLI
jgi:hypothetical protein